MKISIITAVLNAEATIAEAIQSVAQQSHKDIEHILVDGGSSDRTMGVVEQYRDHLAVVISEPDSGIYDAMNKGLKLATGDVIGILNADDVYQDKTVLTQVAQAHDDSNLDACYADLVYVRQNDLSRVVRYWRSRDYVEGLSFKGWMPAHPTLFLKKQVYDQAGLFNTELDYQADLEFCARIFEVHKIRSRYIPKLWVRMRLGGATNKSLANMLHGNWESYKALQKLGLESNPISYFTIKFLSKIPQFFVRNV